jgi:hypothetical protein
MPGELSGRRAPCHVAFIPLPSSCPSAAFVSLLPQQHCREAGRCFSAPAAPPKLCYCLPSQPCPWARSSHLASRQVPVTRLCQGGSGNYLSQVKPPKALFQRSSFCPAPAHWSVGAPALSHLPSQQNSTHEGAWRVEGAGGCVQAAFVPEQPRVWQRVTRLKPRAARV